MVELRLDSSEREDKERKIIGGSLKCSLLTELAWPQGLGDVNGPSGSTHRHEYRTAPAPVNYERQIRVGYSAAPRSLGVAVLVPAPALEGEAGKLGDLAFHGVATLRAASRLLFTLEELLVLRSAARALAVV